MLVSAANDKVSKINKIYALITFLLAIVAIVIRALCLEFYYDDEIGYFQDALLPKILTVLCVVGAVFFLSSCFLIKKDTVCSDGKEDNVILKIASCLCIIACIAYFSISVFSTSLVASGFVFDLLSKLSVLMAVAYFAINLFTSDGARITQTVLGFGLIYFSIYVIAITYFDIYVQLNSPDKIMIHLALIAAMLFFVGEFRCFVGIQKRKFYLFDTSLSVFFTGIASIPSLIKGLSGGIEAYKYFAYDIVVLSFFMYSSARLISYAFGIGGKTCVEKDEKTCENTDETEKE